MKLTKPTFLDYFFIFLFLLSSLFSFKLMSFKKDNDLFVVIFQNNRVVYKEKISIEKIIQLNNAVVEIKNNKVKIKQSICPFRICMHTGWISKAGQQIVCIPNRIFITIESKKKEIDTIVY
ncbi:MAG: NusG domain II-containing protein [Endomicrobiia bacterium]